MTSRRSASFLVAGRDSTAPRRPRRPTDGPGMGPPRSCGLIFRSQPVRMLTGDEVVPFEVLADADLIVDRLYDGGISKMMADDPLARMLPIGYQGGFRYAGSPKQGGVRLGVLYTTTAE